jgi:hypothetical protein
VIKTVWDWHKMEAMEQNGKPRNNFTSFLANWFFTQEPRTHNGKRMLSFDK